MSNHTPLYLKHISRSSRQITVLWELLNSAVFYQIFILRFYKKGLITAASSNTNSEKKPRNISVKKKKKRFLGFLDAPYVTAESAAFQMFMAKV